MKEEIKKWSEEFSLDENQKRSIESGCKEAVKGFRQADFTKETSFRDSMKLAEKFCKILDQMEEENLTNLTLLAILGNKSAVKEKGNILNFSRLAVKNLKWLCENAISNYHTNSVSKGGAPERIPGRRALAIVIALNMDFVGLQPTKTPDTGAFDKLLRIVLKEAGVFSDANSEEYDKDLKSVRDQAVDFIVKKR